MMKEGSGVLVIPQQRVAAVSPSAAFLSPAMGGVRTPSPFSFSVASSRWSCSSRPSINVFNFVLRAMVLVFSFASSLALAVTMSDNNKHGFQEYTEFIYSFVVTTLTFVYSAYQLFKGVSDISCSGILISDKVSDYINFVLDQLACYLLVSCSSVTAVTIHQRLNETCTSVTPTAVAINQRLNENTSLKKAAIVSVSMSVAALLTTTASAILSGYKLSKRIMW